MSDDFNQRHLKRRAATCEHFTGTQNDTCKLGISYAELGDDSRPGMGLRLPCIPLRDPAYQGGVDPHEKAKCDRFSARGIEAVTAEFKDDQVDFAKVALALSAVQSASGGQNGVAGKTDCPVCEDGTLSYSVGRTDRSGSGSCSTAGCVRWVS